MLDTLPPDFYIDVQELLSHMSVDDVKAFKEYCMIRFPSRLYKAIFYEAGIMGIGFEHFVRLACGELIKKRRRERNEEEKNTTRAKSH